MAATSNALPPAQAPLFDGKTTLLYTQSGPVSTTSPAMAVPGYTIQFWAYPVEAPPKVVLFCTEDNLMVYTVMGVLYIETPGGPLSTTATLRLNAWSHISVVYQYNTSTVHVFVNAVEVGSTITSQYALQGNVVQVGAYIAGNPGIGYTPGVGQPGSFYSGMISELQIWLIAQPPTAASIAQRLPVAPGMQAQLWGYWPMDQIAGDLLYDLSGNGNNAEVVGNLTMASMPGSVVLPNLVLPTGPVAPVVPPKPVTPGPVSPSPGPSTPPSSTSLSNQTLSDVARGIQHVVNSTQEVMEQHFLRLMERYFDAEGKAITQTMQINDNYSVTAPLIALIPPSTLLLDEMDVQLSVRVDQATVKEFDLSPNPGIDFYRSSFQVTLAPIAQPDASPPNVIAIRMKFKSGDQPEAISRIINEFTATILPVQSSAALPTSSIPPTPPAKGAS